MTFFGSNVWPRQNHPKRKKNKKKKTISLPPPAKHAFGSSLVSGTVKSRGTTWPRHSTAFMRQGFSSRRDHRMPLVGKSFSLEARKLSVELLKPIPMFLTDLHGNLHISSSSLFLGNSFLFDSLSLPISCQVCLTGGKRTQRQRLRSPIFELYQRLFLSIGKVGET